MPLPHFKNIRPYDNGEPIFRDSGNVDEEYRAMIRKVLRNGVDKGDRTGVGTRSMFGHLMRFDMSLGFPLVTLKKTNFRPILQELLWMLDSVDASYRERGFGPHNIKYLCDNNVTIWNEWPHKAYAENNTDLEYMVANEDYTEYRPYDLKEFAEKIRQDDEFARIWGELGNVYGQQWRYWQGGIDQVQQAVDLLKNSPDSRRIMVTAWNPADVPDALLPPCHYCFQYWSKEIPLLDRIKMHHNWPNMCEDMKSGTMDPEDTDMLLAICEKANIPKRKLSMMFNMRSVDTVLGMPFDIASYALQLMMMSWVTNMVPDELLVVSGDTHIYANHMENLPEFIDRPARPLPTVRIRPGKKDMKSFRFEDFELANYDPHPAVRFPIAV